MSTMTAQNINFCPLRTHPILPFFKMKPPTESLDTDISKSTNTDDLLERIGLSEIDFQIPTSIDLGRQRVSRHLSGGGLLLDKKSSYELSSNPFKNKLRLVLAKEEEYSSRNPFKNSSLKKEIKSQTYLFTIPKTISQATQTADDIPWLLGDQSEQDLRCLQASMKGLLMSGWYYENIGWKDSITLLENSELGTFFVRDSADPNFLFTLSVQTIRGPTSVRLHYINGRFRLDAEPKLIPTIPSFVNVIELIEYYVSNSNKMKNKINRKNENDQVWIDLNGDVYTNILLSKPLIKDKRMLNLQHLCRLKVNSILRSNVKKNSELSQNSMSNVSSMISNQINKLPISLRLKDYLNEYPFTK